MTQSGVTGPRMSMAGRGQRTRTWPSSPHTNTHTHPRMLAAPRCLGSQLESWKKGNCMIENCTWGRSSNCQEERAAFSSSAASAQAPPTRSPRTAVRHLSDSRTLCTLVFRQKFLLIGSLRCGSFLKGRCRFCAGLSVTSSKWPACLLRKTPARRAFRPRMLWSGLALWPS